LSIISKAEYRFILRRRREGKTHYGRRRAIILGRTSFISVCLTDKNISAQILQAHPEGDLVVTSAHSRELIKYGWKGSRKNTPAAYLTGLLLGLRTLSKDIHKVILYVGIRPYIHRSRIAALVKGMVDAGLDVGATADTLPDKSRISGEHIASYAKALSKESGEAYKTRFSALLKAGLSPEEYPKHFEIVKGNIMMETKVKSK
jgi:large subunit ribosomal protein L18